MPKRIKWPEQTHDIVSDLLHAKKQLDKIVAPMELYVSPTDKQMVMDMCEATAPKGATLDLGSLPIIEDTDLAPSHWCAVMSDNTIDVFGKSAERVALKILARKSYLRIGKLKVK